MRFPRITVWRAIFAAILLSGLYATYLRIFYGLGGSTNLSDKFPWGIWIAFDVMCGVALAAGGFTLVAIVHIFNIQKYRPVLRPCILTAFLGYILVVIGLLFDLGRPDRLWHPLVMWNPHSVMFEVARCVTLYGTVLFLEFIPVVFEKFGWHKPIEWVHRISVPMPPVECDANQIQQVVLVLMVNGSEAMPKGGVLEVTTEFSNLDEQGLVRVRDTGCGIPEDVFPRIFDPFFTTKQDQNRTRLGLAVAHSIVEQHAGEISVRSTPGEGTEFIVRLAAADAKLTAAVAAVDRSSGVIR